MGWMPGVSLDSQQLALLNAVGIMATALAALLAAGAVIQSGRQARRAENAMIRERRLRHELDVLRDLGSAITIVRAIAQEMQDHDTATRRQVGLLLTMLPTDPLPECHGYADGAALDLADAQEEIAEAVRRRM